MLEKVRMALRIQTSRFDDELTALIASAKKDLEACGVKPAALENPDPLVSMAIITYCKVNFGQNEDAERLKASYDEQKAQLIVAKDYRA